MSKKFLIVVDMQNDFVSGSLGTKEAEDIVSRVVKKVTEFDGQIYFTQDTHEDYYMQTQEGKLLPVEHCIIGTQGWKLIQELEEIQKAKNLKVFQKSTFGSTKLAEELQKIWQMDKIESVELVGLCTDVCVISNALMIKAYLPEVPVYVDASCCAGVNPDSHTTSLNAMKACQILVQNMD